MFAIFYFVIPIYQVFAIASEELNSPCTEELMEAFVF